MTKRAVYQGHPGWESRLSLHVILQALQASSRALCHIRLWQASFHILTNSLATHHPITGGPALRVTDCLVT